MFVIEVNDSTFVDGIEKHIIKYPKLVSKWDKYMWIDYTDNIDDAIEFETKQEASELLVLGRWSNYKLLEVK